MSDPMWTETIIALPKNFITDGLKAERPDRLEVTFNAGMSPEWEENQEWEQGKVILWYCENDPDKPGLQDFLDCGRVPLVEVVFQLQILGYYPGVLYRNGRMDHVKGLDSHNVYTWMWQRRYSTND